ncbi:SEC-C metal-binding domain-containing protein [Candidatus Omnitrophota bacterium]
MSKKVGRNESCPCGSGKKYKKCCGMNEKMDYSIPEDLRTGTVLDDYMMLYQGVAFFAEGFMKFDKDGKELKKAASDFERKFKPGQDDGVPSSLFMTWLHFDFRFGDTKETICERFLKSPFLNKLNEPGPTHARHFADSYCTFYEIKTVLDDKMIFEELGTGYEWIVYRANEPFEKEAQEGDIWYLRLIGLMFAAYMYTPPYIFPSSAKSNFTKATRKQKEVFLKDNYNGELSENNIFRESCRAATLFWVEYMLLGNSNFIEEEKIAAKKMPELQNTDGEPMRFSKTFFKIKQREGLTEKLSSVQNFRFDEDNNMWIWYKKGNRRIRSFPTTILGTLSIAGNYLIAEINSLQRALRLKSKLSRGFNQYLTYEKIEAKDFGSMPQLSEEEMERFEKNQKELYADPKVRKFLKDKAEDYYHNDWMRQKIPALDYKTPTQAVKTESGRQKLEDVLTFIDRSQRAMPDDPHKVDINGLRKRLGLPVLGGKDGRPN